MSLKESYTSGVSHHFIHNPNARIISLQNYNIFLD